MINAITLKRNASGTQGGCASIDYLLAQELAREKARQVVGYYDLLAPSEEAESRGTRKA